MASQRKRKTGSVTVEEAFGGQRKLWPLGRRWPGVSCYRVALKRLSRPVPTGSTPSEFLECWGFQKNESTLDLFWLTDNYKEYFQGRIIPANVATKWILNVCGRSAATQAAGEELSSTNRTGEFQGASLQFFPVVESSPGDMFIKNEQAFSTKIVEDVEKWLSSRPLQEGHIRLFHGTSTQSMNNILQSGINIARFQPVGDFGSGFYCADKVQTVFRFAALTALEQGFGRQSASLMYFDVKSGDLDQLKQIKLEGAQWSAWTGICLNNKEETVYRGEGRSALQLVIGKLVHNPHEVELDGATTEAFDDNRKQYCFRNAAGNMLLKNPTQMGVALFDVSLPQDSSATEEPNGEHAVDDH
jgi:hypothetical protein